MEGTVGRRPPSRASETLGPGTRPGASEDTFTSTTEGVTHSVDMIAGRYKLQEILGRGGVGVVYRARDLHLDVEIAIKVLQGQATRDAAELERFKREIITARQITHANVIRIHDFGMSGEEAFISMELLAGGTLADRIEDGPLPLREGLEVAIGICEGLEAAHAMKIIHRDIKPDNVLFDAQRRPKLVDFGLARLASAPTRTIGFSGTPFYVSPEQAEGGEVSIRSDIYSLGVLLFEVFTGRLPFLADNLVRLALMHANEQPPAPRSVNPDVPAILEAVILRCLEKDPGRRYQSASAVATDLRAVRDGRVPPGIGENARDQATVIRAITPAPKDAPAGEQTAPAVSLAAVERTIATPADRGPRPAVRPQQPPSAQPSATALARPPERVDQRPSGQRTTTDLPTEAVVRRPRPLGGIVFGAGSVILVGAVVGSFWVAGRGGDPAPTPARTPLAARTTPPAITSPGSAASPESTLSVAVLVTPTAPPVTSPARPSKPTPAQTRPAASPAGTRVAVAPTPTARAVTTETTLDLTSAPPAARTGEVAVTLETTVYRWVRSPALSIQCGRAPIPKKTLERGRYEIHFFEDKDCRKKLTSATFEVRPGTLTKVFYSETKGTVLSTHGPSDRK